MSIEEVLYSIAGGAVGATLVVVIQYLFRLAAWRVRVFLMERKLIKLQRSLKEARCVSSEGK